MGLGSATSVAEFWLRDNSEPRLKYKQVYLEIPRGRKSEPAGLYGLRKQVTEAKEGPLELGERKQGCSHLREGERGKLGCALERTSPGERTGWGKAQLASG